MPIFNLNSQESTINVSEDVLGQGNRSTVSVSNVSAIVLPPNPVRGNYQIYNAGTVPCFLAHDATVTAESYEFPLPVGNLWYPDISNGRYLGAVSAITGTGSTSLKVTEFTIL